jgi:hypothetical protein
LKEQQEDKFGSVSKKLSEAYMLVHEAHDELKNMGGPKSDIAKLWSVIKRLDSLGLEIETTTHSSMSQDEPSDYGYDEVEVDDFTNYSNPKRVR